MRPLFATKSLLTVEGTVTALPNAAARSLGDLGPIEQCACQSWGNVIQDASEQSDGDLVRAVVSVVELGVGGS